MTVDSTAGTGQQSRWNTILGGGAVVYTTPRKGARFTSEPLAADLTITGHPVVHLQMGGGVPEVFVYLEEVDSTGAAHLVSEGQLDLRHRKVSQAPVWYPRPEAFHSYRRGDLLDVRQGRIEAAVELLPTSHRYSRGNRIRIVVGGADKDHFKVNGAGSGVAIGGHRVVLPVER